MPRIFLAVASVLVVFLVMRAGLFGDTAPTRPVHIYMSVAEEDPAQVSAAAAAKLALESQRGLVLRRPIELVVLPNGGLVSREEENAKRAVADSDAVAYIGPAANDLVPISAPILEAAHIAQVVITPAPPDTNRVVLAPSSDTLRATSHPWRTMAHTIVYTSVMPGGAPEGAYAVVQGIPPLLIGSEKAREFYNSYVHKYGTEPSILAPFAYDAVGALMTAVSTSKNPDRGTVRDALRSTTNHNGALGTWSINENGENTAQPISLYVVQEGKWQFVETLSN
jgi:ABC-type branched-subunit amino acid transport system substrate-binding protein